MSHTTLQNGPPFRDAMGARLRVAVLASLLVNVALWSMAAAVAKHPPAYDPKPVEITRVIINQQGKKIEKKITSKQIAKKIAQLPKRKPPEPRRTPPPHPVRHKPIQVVQRIPQGAHTHVIIAKLAPHAPPPAQDEPTALTGGNAAPGKVIDQQNPGNAAANPPTLVVKAPEPAPPTPMPQPAPVVEATEPALVVKAPEPVKPQPEPVPEPVKLKGPSKEAEPVGQVKPEIPDSLKQQGGYKSFVRVKVVVAADGSATPILRTSSGNPDIDNRVLEALKQWRWKPALKNGVPVESTQLFKFEFEVE